jgi:2'-5' RNA ligase
MIRSILLAIVFLSNVLIPRPPAPGMERLFVIADVPAVFNQTQRSISKKLDKIVHRGAFRPAKTHMTILDIGDVPLYQITRVKKAVDAAMREFQKRSGSGALTGISAQQGLEYFGTNALVFRMNVSSETKALFDILYKHVSRIKRPHAALPWKPHITLGRVSKMGPRKRRRLNIFLKTVSPPVQINGKGNDRTLSIDHIHLFAGRAEIAHYDLTRPVKNRRKKARRKRTPQFMLRGGLPRGG